MDKIEIEEGSLMCFALIVVFLLTAIVFGLMGLFLVN